MLRRITMVFVVSLVLLSACSSNTFTFTGKTDNWSAEIKVTQQSNGYSKQEITLEYRGENTNSVGKITYDVDTNAGGFGGSGNVLNENGVLRSSSESNPTNAKITEESKVKVKVKWNGKTETITLSND